MKWVVGIVGLLLLVGMCSAVGDSGDGGVDRDEGDGFMAEVMCENFIEDRLKAPGTADFSDSEHTELGPEKWKVTGVVDSENSFGALLRLDYSCVMTYKGDDRWRGAKITLDER